ncbi:MAG: nucleotide pyrophosphatase/phosphodiesterase family protein, partial [Verrucomicrobiota bacterium]
MFVWGGTEQVTFTWVEMDDDFEVAEFETPRYSTTHEETAAPVLDGENFVLWLSISGFRADYLEKADTPFLDGVGGTSSRAFTPTFPALNWSSLMSQATGLTADGHGIVGNTMRDPNTGKSVPYPTKLSVLKAEPIWTTAKKAGLGVLVHDWPFSQEQPEAAADVFKPTFDISLSDEDRLNALFDAWASHQGENKLRLIMGSLHGLRKAAQTHSTSEEETLQAITKLDATLSGFFRKVIDKWPDLRNGEGDKLHVVITTDHGMVDAEKLINFEDLMGDMAKQVDYIVDEGIAHIWFKDTPPDGMDMDEFVEFYDSELKKRTYWRSFSQDTFPSDWKLAAEGGHLGDRLLLLKPPYAFHTEKGSEAVYAPAETGGPFAASGYWVNDSSRMKGQMFAFSLTGGGSFSDDLGEVRATQIYPSVCQLLGI